MNTMHTYTAHPVNTLTNWSPLRKLLAPVHRRLCHLVKPTTRLELMQLDALLRELETGYYSISSANLYRLRMQRHVATQVERANRLQRNARTPEENRWEDEDDDAKPDVPRPYSLTPHRFVVLADGRRARALDGHHAMPLCGVRELIELSRDDWDRRHCASGRYCRTCGGYHLRLSQRAPSITIEAKPSSNPRCPHCQQQHVRLLREGDVVELHCLCGWMTLVSTMDSETVTENELAISRFQEPASGQVMKDGEMSSEHVEIMLFGETTEDDDDLPPEIQDTENSEDNEESESESESLMAEDLEDGQIFVSALTHLWQTKPLAPVRQCLLERTVFGDLTSVRRDVLWLTAALVTMETQQLPKHEAQQLVDWLAALDEADMVELWPEEFRMDPPSETITSLVSAKITKWMRGCRRALQRFRYPQAGVRILAPKFGVSERAFAMACGL